MTDYADMVAGEIAAAGWTYGHKTTVRPDGREMHVVDAHRGNLLPRYVVSADTKLGALLALRRELQVAGPGRHELGTVLRLREAVENVPEGLYMLKTLGEDRAVLEVVGEDDNGDLVLTGAGYAVAVDDLEQFESTGVSFPPQGEES